MPAVRIAYRRFIACTDHQAWDFAVWLGQGCKGPVHTDLVLPSGRIFTATTTDGATFVTRDYNGAEAGWWDFEDLVISDAEARQLEAWCEQCVSERHPYDWWGVLRFVFFWYREHPDAYFCSESTVAALQTLGFFPGVKPWQMSPARVFKADKSRPLAAA